MGLIGWSWVFLAFYVGLMIAFGVIGHRKVSNADEFATARGGYGPLFLAFAFAATTASGATFVGESIQCRRIRYRSGRLWATFFGFCVRGNDG